MEFNLSAFKNVDPDKIYTHESGEGSSPALTFFYNTKLHTAPYPATHDDVFAVDEDEKGKKIVPELSKEIFYDTFPNAKDIITSFNIENFLEYKPGSPVQVWLEKKIEQTGINPQKFKSISLRQKLIQFGESLIGRVGIYNGDLVIALWQGKEHPRFQSFVNDPSVAAKIMGHFGPRYPMREWIIVPFKEEPTLYSSISSIKKATPERKTGVEMPSPTAGKTYKVAGNEFTISQLASMRGATHSAAGSSNALGAALSILCHPDMLKYPELRGYIPSVKCKEKEPETKLNTKSDTWQQAAKDLYMKQSGNKAQTGLLYSPWKSQSESYSFKNWIFQKENN